MNKRYEDTTTLMRSKFDHKLSIRQPAERRSATANKFINRNYEF